MSVQRVRKMSGSGWASFALCGLVALGLTGLGTGSSFFAEAAGVAEISGVSSTGEATAYEGIDVELVSMMLRSGDPLRDGAVPPLGESANIDSFFDITLSLRQGGGSEFQVDSFFDITYRITERTQPDDRIFTLDTEMISMVVDSPNPVLGEFILRESPTAPSLGQEVAVPFGERDFIVDSFFDVFTEISVDGGQSFHAATSPVRLVLAAVVPEPATGLLLSLAAFAAVGRRRR